MHLLLVCLPPLIQCRSYVSSSRPSLPKRGDKEFEPATDGATNLQTHSLNRARDAMFGALDAERGISKYVQFQMSMLALFSCDMCAASL
jgi:hypothetical protein